MVEALREGQAFLTSEEGEEDVDENIKMVMGEYPRLKAELDIPEYRSRHYLNRLGKNINDIASAITDFRPTWRYKTFNPTYQAQGDILDKLSVAWWYNQVIDLKLQLVVKQSLVARTGYAHIVFDPMLSGGFGDCDLIPRDYREVIPIRPNSKLSIQDALGAIIHTRKSVNWGRARYPNRSHNITPTVEGSSFAKINTRFRTGNSALDYLDAQRGKMRDFNLPTYDHYEVYVHDDSINAGQAQVWIGPGPEGESPWGYWVQPNRPLYPRGRLMVIANMQVLLFDGPNPYWHGMFPIVKLTLDPFGWSFLGKSSIADAKSPQMLSNELLRGTVDILRKNVRPGAIIDKNAMPRAKAERLDTSRPGWAAYINPGVGQGMVLETPPQVPMAALEMRRELAQDIDYVMGVLDMRALAQVQQMQGTGDVEQMLEHLGPSVRMRGRVLEVFLREVGDIMKGNFFQFYNRSRRFQILGAKGLQMEDFDFDPGTLVPDFANSNLNDQEMNRFYAGSTLRPRAERAQEHIHSFQFHLEPNSLLNLTKVQKQMMYFQLFRAGGLDLITLWEALEIPNTGAENAPGTVMERMQMASQTGLTGAISSAGRKSSGEGLPRMKMQESG